ncbi:MAG: PepSY domain-containing protein [Alphaproteobacteria bacterium]|nr:PepSY domain-containing protein [Alphaproteobacteria bacterium]
MRAVLSMILVLFALALSMPAANADGRGGPMIVQGFASPRPGMTVQQGMVPLDRVLPTVHRTVPGRVLDVQVVGGAYRVKVLTANGRVAHVLVDGRSGQVMRVE